MTAYCTKTNSLELTDAQKDAISPNHNNVCVVAGAGTGKTTVLVEKFIDLVTGDKGLGTDEVLAITFTEMAALEMKRKVHDRFSQIGLESLKREAESAHISTIHGFCANILRENPMEAGVDPAFVVTDEVTSAAFMEQALESFFEEPPLDLLELVQLYEEGFIARAVTDAIRRYRSMGYSTKNFMFLPDAITRVERIIAAKNGMLSSLAADLKKLAETLDVKGVTDKLEEKRVGVIGFVSRLKSSSPDVNVIREIRKQCLNIRSKAPEDSDPGAYHRVADTMKEIKNRCDARKWLLETDDDSERDADIHRNWLHLAAREVLKRYDGYKEELNALDFEDLQLKVKELFTGHPHILKRYRSRFKAVLVDEYQDVNRLQAELIEMLAQKNDLFAVGDPKQLIYEFRDADPKQFENFYNNVKADSNGTICELNESFRSRQRLLDFINPFSISLLANMKFPIQPMQSTEGLHLSKNIPSVEMIVRQMENGESIDEARESEAHGVASRIKEIVGLPEAVFESWGLEEPFGYGDIAVLFRSSTAVKIYEKAFKAEGIPHSVSKGSGFFQSREFADALSLLQVIDNALQDIPMAAVLRSPFVGVSDDTLFLLRTTPDKNEHGAHLSETLLRLHEIEGLKNGEREKLERFAELLSNLRAERRRAGHDELLEMALAETSYQAVILSDNDGLQKAANMKKVLQFIREHRSSGTEDLSSMCRFMETTMRADVKEKEAFLEPEGGDAVNLITIHGAKGLEFPIVVLADMGRDYLTKGRGQGIYVSEEYGVCCKHREREGDEVENIGYHLSSEKQKENQLDEEKRLLYVAMTRAREHLILAGTGRFDKEVSMQTATSPMQSVLAALGQTHTDEDENHDFAAEPEIVDYGNSKVRIERIAKERRPCAADRSFTLKDRYENEIVSGLKIPSIEPDKNLLDTVTARLDYKERPLPEKPTLLSITGLLEYRQCPARYYFKYRQGVPEEETFLPSSSGRSGGAEFGSKVHAILNLFDFGKDPEEQLPALSRAAGIHPEHQDEVMKLLRVFTSCNLFMDLRSADELYRELPFSMKLDGANLSGVMDVLFRKGEGSWFILDYKTDDVEGDEITARAEAYFFQIFLYGLALQQTFGYVPQKVMLYFLRPGSVQEKEVSESTLRATGEEAERLIAGIRSDDFPLVKSPRCFSCAYGSTFCKILE